MRTQIKILALAAFMGLASAAVYAGSIIALGFDNKTDMRLDLYVDGAYGCTASARLTCSTQVQAGVHLLEAKSGQRIIGSETADVEEGSSWWRVFYENP